MTVSPVSTLQYLTTWPKGGTFPIVSTLNDYTGGLVANAAIVPAGTGGDIEVFVTDATDVIIDIDGYFAPPGSTGALTFYPLPPCRVADTRSYGGKTGSLRSADHQRRSIAKFPGVIELLHRSRYRGGLFVEHDGMAAWKPAAIPYPVWPVGQSFPTVSTLNAPKRRCRWRTRRLFRREPRARSMFS